MPKMNDAQVKMPKMNYAIHSDSGLYECLKGKVIQGSQGQKV
jgi:hypothetical protein